MRILLDESLPRPLSRLLIGHDVRTVTQVGWTSYENGELLAQAAASNRLESLEPLVPRILEVLRSLPSKTLIRVGA